MKIFKLFFSVLMAIAFIAAPANAQEIVPSNGTPIVLSGVSFVAAIPGTSLFFDNEQAKFAENKAEIQASIENDIGCITCEIFVTFTTAVFGQLRNVDSSASGLIPVAGSIALILSFVYLFSGFVTGDASDLLGRWQVFWRLMMSMAFATIVLASDPVAFVWEYIFGNLFALGNGIINSVDASLLSDCPASPINIYPEDAATAIQNMNQSVCASFKMTVESMATGIALIVSPPGSFSGIITFIVAGTFVTAIYAFLALVFPLRFIDIVVRLAIISIISPVLVVAAAFKPFRGYAFGAIGTVLNAMAQFVLLAIILRIGAGVVEQFSQDLFAKGLNEEATATQVVISAFALVGVALVFSALVKSVPALASELTRSTGGGGEGGNAAIKTIAAPASIAAGGAGAAVGLVGKGAVLYQGAKIAGRGLGKGVN